MPALNQSSFSLLISQHPIVVNVFCSFTASILFIYFILWLYKPRVEIWPMITKKIDDFDQKGTMAYWFKIRNRSWFKAFDITAELYEVVATHGNKNSRHFELPLKKGNFNYIGRKKSTIFTPNYTNNSLIFRTYCDLPSILNDDTKSIQIEVTLRHGLTGITGIYLKQFISDDIKEGFFRPGRRKVLIS